MKRMGWVVLALAVVCFVSCSKEGPAGPAGSAGAQGSTGSTGAQGSTGSTGAQGAAGIPRKVYIERAYRTESNVSGQRFWTYVTTLPWTPASNGVIANFRGFVLSQWNGGDCSIYSVGVSGTTVTIYGVVSSELSPYNYTAYFDIIAYDTLNTVMFVDKTPPSVARMIKSPVPAVKSNLP